MHSNKNIFCCIGYYLDLMSALSIKSFFFSFGIFSIIYEYKISWLFDFNVFFLLNYSLNNLEKGKIFLFIACDLRLEAPLLNTRIRKNFNINKNKELFFFSFGLALKHLTFPVNHLGNMFCAF
jgi:hypothetical protein